MALAAPALIHTQTSTAGVFDAGRPIDGLLGLIGIIGAAICLASHNSDSPNATGSLATVMIGPFVGGIMLIAVSTATALSLTTTEALILIVILAVIAILVRIRLPTIPTIIRRALVTPYVMVSGSLFWRLINEVTGGNLISQLRTVPLPSFQTIEPVVGFLLAFSTVYYAMLIYAPRQFAESEGSLLSWLIRYLLFALGIWLGATWLIG
jgi:hypothetical protein